MKQKIIDFHTHLGDIFHGNQSIAFKRPGVVPHPECADPFKDLEESGFTRPLIVNNQEQQNVLIDAGQYRVWDRGNIYTTGEMMDRCGVSYICSLPIMPNTSFEEALAASKLDSRYLPFTCPDFGLSDHDMMEKLKRDISMGARGLKIHPILQNIEITDWRCEGPIRLFGELGLPITYHCGVNDYYKPDSPWLKFTNLDYGKLEYTFELLKKFPDYVIVPAHCGGNCGGELEALAEEVKRNRWDKVYVDLSHRGSEDIARAAELFGEDRVMYASDWPFDTCDCNIRCALDAFGGDREALDKYFYRNAARILRIERI